LISDVLRQSAEKYRHRPCLKASSGKDLSSLSYGELDVLVDRLSAYILARGMGPLQRICIISENRPEWVIGYMSVLRAGCTVVPLDCLSKPEDIRHLVRLSKAGMLFCSGKFSEQVQGLCGRDGVGSGPVCFDKVEGFTPLSGVLAAGERLIKEGAPCERRTSDDDPAVLIFTSGTTGASKGVVLSHRNISFDVSAVLGSIPLCQDDRALSVLPLHHTLESTAGLLAPLSRGASITYARSLRSKEILSDLLECRATVFISVPLMYEKMAAGIRREIAKSQIHKRLSVRLLLWLSATAKDKLNVNAGALLLRSIRRRAGLNHMRVAVSGAAPLRGEVQKFFSVLGVEILEGYGLTEAAPVVSVSELGRLRHGSVGRPIPGVDVRILNPDAQGIGEILVKGQNVMSGYLESPGSTEDVLCDGWLHTGDLGRLDEDGYLYVCGRSKNVIVTQAGKKIFPEEVEAVLAGSPVLREAMVTGKRNPISGREEVHAIIYPDYEWLQNYAEERSLRLGEEEIRNIIRAEIRRLCVRLPDYKRVRDFTIRQEEFPKTSTKKIKRQAI